MPRKTDGIAFELQPRPTKGDDGKPLLYAQPIITRKYTIDDLDKYCNKNRQTIKGDVKHFFDLLEDVASYLLSQGCRIETSFGSFAPKLKLLGDHPQRGRVLSLPYRHRAESLRAVVLEDGRPRPPRHRGGQKRRDQLP